MVPERLGILRRLRSPADGFLFLRIFLFAAAVPALLRLKLSTLQSLLEPGQVPPAPEPSAVEKITKYVDEAIRIGRPFVRPGCLTRGVTLYYFLRRVGLDVQLCFGMGAPGGDEFAGHCWLVKDGEPFLERQDPRPVFVEMYRIPSAPAASAS